MWVARNLNQVYVPSVPLFYQSQLCQNHREVIEEHAVCFYRIRAQAWDKEGPQNVTRHPDTNQRGHRLDRELATASIIVVMRE